MKGFTLRIEDELLEKFHYICKYHRRSANQQLLLMIEGQIKAFEQKHGPITKDQLQALYREGN